MHDLVVREALTTMARDAAKRFHELVAAGEEVPYEVKEPGDGSPIFEYEPQTAMFVRDHATALRDLDSFGAACAALENADLAGPYLEAAGITVPPDPKRRSELAGVVFLARLWQDSTDFSLPDDRLQPALLEMAEGGEPTDDEIEVVVQLRGLQMPLERLELATATIVRADAVEVPKEARASDGTGAAGWQPTFLAVARVGDTVDAEDAPDAGARAVEAFRALITTLRLFKSGGVGLGPHAWARSGSDRWRRISTGEGRPRPGGYVLAEDELSDLVAFSRTVANRSTPFGRPAKGRPGFAGTLARAVSRFEIGLERAAALEALSDYLLALRFVLDGGGPADLGLPMRVAALCSEPDERGETKTVIERAMALERELWIGEPAGRSDLAPADVTLEVEDLARAIFKDAACGHLGNDLRVTADEILLADGLSIGEGAPDQRGATAEWDPADEEDGAEHEWAAGEELPIEDEAGWETAGDSDDEPVERPEVVAWADDVSVEGWTDEPIEYEPIEHEPTLAEELAQVTDDRGRITAQQNFEPEEDDVVFAPEHASEAAKRVLRERPVTAIAGEDAQEPSPVVDLIRRTETERRDVNDRVAFLFPKPETCQWDVREVGYDRTRRAEVS
jgi:hypothetical protein